MVDWLASNAPFTSSLFAWLNLAWFCISASVDRYASRLQGQCPTVLRMCRVVPTIITKSLHFLCTHWNSNFQERACENDLWHQLVLKANLSPIFLVQCEVETWCTCTDNGLYSEGGEILCSKVKLVKWNIFEYSWICSIESSFWLFFFFFLFHLKTGMKAQSLDSFLAIHIWMSFRCFMMKWPWNAHWEWLSSLPVSLLILILTQVSSLNLFSQHFRSDTHC